MTISLIGVEVRMGAISSRTCASTSGSADRRATTFERAICQRARASLRHSTWPGLYGETHRILFNGFKRASSYRHLNASVPTPVTYSNPRIGGSRSPWIAATAHDKPRPRSARSAASRIVRWTSGPAQRHAGFHGTWMGIVSHAHKVHSFALDCCVMPTLQ